MLIIKESGDFSKTNSFFQRMLGLLDISLLDSYGKEGVKALSAATPKDTGETANSWYYEIERSDGRATLTFCNANIQNGTPIAIILQYGHATKNGSWVEGVDYINPALKPVFEKIANDIWKEVSK